MPSSTTNEISIIASLLRLDIENKPPETFVRQLLSDLENQSVGIIKIFRRNFSEILMHREADGKGHLKTAAISDLYDFCKVESWLIDQNVTEKAARVIVRGLQDRVSPKFMECIREENYKTLKDEDVRLILTKTGITESDANKFLEITEEMEVSLKAVIVKPFLLNYRAEIATRKETLRKAMTLKELISLYLFTFMELILSEYGLDEKLISDIALRLGQCNNMKRQFLIINQLERYFFGEGSAEEAQSKPKEFWLSLINEFELKIALEQYVLEEKIKKSSFELADLYVEARNLFLDMKNLQDETLAVISITYRLDNPEEKGHTVEELLGMIDQTIVMTQELSPLPVMIRDIFAFFELLGECDHHNKKFRQTIVQFRSRIKKLSADYIESGDRIPLAQLVLTYLYSRLDAYLSDEEMEGSMVIDSIRDRLAQCNNFERQFAIVNLIERHIFENPGLLQIVDPSYWPELINTFELNIILEAYIDRKYIRTQVGRKSKFDILNEILSHINAIEPINVKSLTVVFLTAHLASHLEQFRQITIEEIVQTIAQLRKDAEMAALQIDMQNQVKRKMLNTLTQRLFRLEALVNELSDENIDLLSRLDEVIVGLRTRRDNLIEGKMDPMILEADITQYLSDPKVQQLFDECESIFKERLTEQAREKKQESR